MGSRPVLLLLQFVILTASVALAAQNPLPDVIVTLSSEKRSINQVLDEITLQTGYFFTYDAALISGSENVRFKAGEVPLENALHQLLRDSLISYRVIDRNIVIFRKNVAPPSPVNKEIDRSFLKGKVVDSESGQPLSYATIGLYGTSLGSVTNQSGDFSFKIPGDIADPLLVISYMGYKDLFLPVVFPVEESMNISLNRQLIPLQEVVIRYSDPVKLLQEALDRIPENYLQDHSSMTAYYRESVRRNESCMIFSEAVLDIAKGPYYQKYFEDNVRIHKGRKISDMSSADTIMLKLRSGIYSSLNLDVIKNKPDFLAEDFHEKYDLDFTDMMTYGDRLVYVISFRQKEHLPELMFTGRIYLDTETLAILATDFEYNPDLIHKEPGLFLVSRSRRVRIRPILARYHVEYKKLDGIYHVSQVRAEVEMKIRKKRQWIGARYRIALEMAITEVNPGDRLKINFADRVRPNTILSDQPFEFDHLFWGPYNTIEPEATLMESIRRLEHNLQEISE
jgi:hypothetical protein